MKTVKFIEIVFLALLISSSIVAQEKEEPKNQVFYVVEKMPEFPGGDDDLKEFIWKSIKYPEAAKKNGVAGKVYITFIVSENGEVQDAKVARGVDPLLDTEALRVINELPKWKPGEQRGEKVKVSYTVPINFHLNGEVKEMKVTSKVIDGKEVYFITEDMPEFPGGELALRKFIANSIKYPVVAIENGIQGKVYVSFVVGKDGKVADAKIARGVAPSLDKEAIRVVESLPTWKPGKVKGEAVDVEYTVPINFVLQ